jgi:hypothetical protein
MWKDKKEVTMISTYHGQETRMKLTKCKQEKEKPVSVLDYNESMVGFDLKDHLLQPYLLKRKKMSKCYIKLFRRLLNTTVGTLVSNTSLQLVSKSTYLYI